MALREIIARLGYQVDRKSESNVRKSMGGLTSSVKKFAVGFGAALGAREVVRGVAQMVKFASDASETTNRLGQVFGEQSGAIEAAMADMARTMNRSRFELEDFASKVGGMATAMAGSKEDAVGLSAEIVSLAQDLSSFSDESPERAFMALRSGLQGLSIPLRNLAALDVSAAAVADSIGMTVGEFGRLSVVEKQRARLNLVRSEMARTGIMGDAARTARMGGNAFRGFTLALKDVQITAGRVLLPTVIDLTLKFTNFLRTLEKSVMQGGALGRTFKLLGGVISVAGNALFFFAKSFADWVPFLIVALAIISPLTAGVLALVAAIGLVGEDMQKADETGKGFFRRMGEGFREARKEGGYLHAVFEQLKTAFNFWAPFFELAWVETKAFLLRVNKAIAEWMETQITKAAKFFSDLMPKGVSQFLLRGQQAVHAAPGAVSGAISAGKDFLGLSGGRGGGGVNQSNDINVTVDATNASNPAEVGEQVKAGLMSSMDFIIRETANASFPQ